MGKRGRKSRNTKQTGGAGPILKSRTTRRGGRHTERQRRTEHKRNKQKADSAQTAGSNKTGPGLTQKRLSRTRSRGPVPPPHLRPKRAATPRRSQERLPDQLPRTLRKQGTSKKTRPRHTLQKKCPTPRPTRTMHNLKVTVYLTKFHPNTGQL